MRTQGRAGEKTLVPIETMHAERFKWFRKCNKVFSLVVSRLDEIEKGVELEPASNDAVAVKIK